MSFVEESIAACGEKWERMHGHPLVREICEGTLPKVKYQFYLEQDYLYLLEFCRVLALLCSRSPDFETMSFFKNLLKEAMELEIDLHVKTCEQFGLTRENLESAKPAPHCLALTGYLLATATKGEFIDGLVAVLPAILCYYEVSRKLPREGLPEEPCYRDWITIYASREMREIANHVTDLTDRLTIDISPARKARLTEYFKSSVDFEIMFWDMAYNLLDSISRPA